MYRLIAADLDETLLDSGHHVPERVRAAISAARELGVRFVPSTGRPFASVAGTLDELGLSGTPDAAQWRAELLKRLDLPEHMSPNALLPVLNALYDRDAFLEEAESWM